VAVSIKPFSISLETVNMVVSTTIKTRKFIQHNETQPKCKNGSQHNDTEHNKHIAKMTIRIMALNIICCVILAMFLGYFSQSIMTLAKATW
jgi:uncharacterized membrane protein